MSPEHREHIETPFDPTDLTRAASDTFSVRRVYGEAYERDGVTVVPVAKVIGGTWSGSGGGTWSGGGSLAHSLQFGRTGKGSGLRGGWHSVEDEAPDGGENGDAGDGEDAGGTHGKGDIRPSLSGESTGNGGGGGYAARVRPIGVYVMDGSGVRWRPAVDVNRVILGGQLLGAVSVTVLSFAWALHRRR